MILNKDVPYKVLLPPWIWEEAKDQQHLKKLVLQYMRHYSNYSVKSIKDGFAICERKG
ncbi:hypothetical protein B4102_3390 [Heyndrickxia sporothermodurans]|uniref:Uncharacterized protein n=1 Tax=Heyndrickxia sporothermodurans TaxID=46224 RepID=A0A150KVM5_9BACI|nr:hypothetical protein B4102_3390 [Heyndrickxia sporothermodurans]